MIKSIVNTINGKTIVERETAKSVYLSDGTHWNKHKFHSNRSIIAALIRNQVDADPIIQEVREEVNRRVKYLKDRVIKMNELYTQNCTMELFAKHVDKTLPFGKYKGQKVCDVAEKDMQYLQWFFSKTKIDFDSVFKFIEK